MKRQTADNVSAAGFNAVGVANIHLDIVKTIRALKPACLQPVTVTGSRIQPCWK